MSSFSIIMADFLISQGKESLLAGISNFSVLKPETGRQHVSGLSEVKVLGFSFPVPVVSRRAPALSLAFCLRKHKKSTARALRLGKNMSSTCRQV